MNSINMRYKIDAIDQRILFELDKNCRISDNSIARWVNRSREAVRYRIKRMQDEGIILEFITSINPSKYGFMFFKLYFQLASKPKERERFFTYMKKLEGLYWIGMNDGIWDAHATFFTRSIKEFYSLKNRIFSEFKDLIVKRDTGVLVNVHQYKKKYLLEDIDEPNAIDGYSEYVMFSDDVVDSGLDALDHRIIGTLVHNGRIPLVELARETGSTVDVVRGRMKKMERSGVILQYRVAVNHAKLGLEFFKSFLYFNNLTKADEKKLLGFASGHPNIIYLIRQVSSWDVEIEMVCKNYEEFTAIMNDIREKFSDSMRNYESVLMKEDIWIFGEKTILARST